jgi:antitoxin (DNA-binding transcriptional repressor) of toxin-antitoxin stability system
MYPNPTIARQSATAYTVCQVIHFASGVNIMLQIPATQAASELYKLLNEVAQGQEVVIVDEAGLAFKLVALPHMPKPIFGSAKGLVNIGADFDEPIEGFEEYTP